MLPGHFDSIRDESRSRKYRDDGDRLSPGEVSPGSKGAEFVSSGRTRVPFGNRSHLDPFRPLFPNTAGKRDRSAGCAE